MRFGATILFAVRSNSHIYSPITYLWRQVHSPITDSKLKWITKNEYVHQCWVLQSTIPNNKQYIYNKPGLSKTIINSTSRLGSLIIHFKASLNLAPYKLELVPVDPEYLKDNNLNIIVILYLQRVNTRLIYKLSAT